jgi:CheY-like chemotaxis protein
MVDPTRRAHHPIRTTGPMEDHASAVSKLRKEVAQWRGDPNAAVPSRILIVDDHASFRRTARLLLEQRRYIVAGEAANCAEAVSAVNHVDPDGVLLDVQLGAECGFAVCATLTRAHPGLSVVLVSASDYGKFTDLMDASQARGFVLKSRLVTTDLSRFWPC